MTPNIKTEGKCFTTSDCNEFTRNTIDVKIKQELVNRSDVPNLATKSQLNTKPATLAKKNRIKNKAT